MKKFLCLVIILGLVGCAPEEEVKEDNIYRAPKEDNPLFGGEPEPQVVEQKVILKNVYVTKEDYGDVIDETTGVSYWYIQYENEDMRGYGTFELSTPYFDLVEAHAKVRKELNSKEGKYTQINSFHRITYEAYANNQ